LWNIPLCKERFSTAPVLICSPTRSTSLINIGTVEGLEGIHLKKNIVIFGFIMVGVGIVTGLVPNVRIPVSSVLVDELFVVPRFEYHHLNWSFQEMITLHITFEVGENRSITFWVLNEFNYYRMRSNESYGWFTKISHPYTSRMDTEWNPPTNTSIYFVWDNHFSYSSKEVYTFFLVEYSRALLPPTASYCGILLLSIGLLIVYYGIRVHVAKIEKTDSLKTLKTMI